MEEKKVKILIVDDEDNLRSSMAAILEMEGYEVYTAEDGFKALEKIKEAAIDIVFMDIVMPGINGVETFLKIREVRPETVVVMMTAYAAEQLKRQAMEGGAYACVSKPFNMRDILHSIEVIHKKT